MAATHRGACYCGAVEIEVHGEPLEMGYCHCENCRRYSAAPVSAFTLWKWEDVSLIKGAEFLSHYQGITDTVTRVHPSVDYPVRQSSSHAIYENSRVQAFAAALKEWQGLEQASPLGELMFQSHQSYSDCGLGSEATDLIVELVRDSLADGLYGARITGGGSGGTVAVLGRSSARPAIESVANRFEHQTGYKPTIFSGSSPGASTFGHVLVNRSEISLMQKEPGTIIEDNTL